MASASPWEEMEENFFTCSICLNNFKDPKQLPCLHRFCRGCLKPVVEKHKKSFPCPLCKFDCKTPAGGVDGFRTDFHSKNIIQFIQLQKAVKDKEIRRCVGCSKESKVGAHCFKCKGFLCEQCFQLHQTSGMLKDHKESVLTLEDIVEKKLTFEKLVSLKQAPACSEHPEKVAEICCGSCDNLPICIVCGQFEKHQGHSLHGVKVLAENERKKAKEIQEKLQANVENLHQIPEEVEDAKKRLETDMTAKKEKLRRQYDLKVETIKAKQTESESTLERIEEGVSKTEQTEVDELERKRQEEIQALNQKFDKLINDVKTKNKEKRGRKGATEIRYLTVLSKTLNSVDEEYKDANKSMDSEGKHNAEELDSISDSSIQRIKRVDNLMCTLKSILASNDDWTDVRCLPEINAAGEPLIEEVVKGFPEKGGLSEIGTNDLRTRVPEKTPVDRKSAVGDKVRMKRSVPMPTLGWGPVNHDRIGVVTDSPVSSFSSPHSSMSVRASRQAISGSRDVFSERGPEAALESACSQEVERLRNIARTPTGPEEDVRLQSGIIYFLMNNAPEFVIKRSLYEQFADQLLNYDLQSQTMRKMAGRKLNQQKLTDLQRYQYQMWHDEYIKFIRCSAFFTYAVRELYQNENCQQSLPYIVHACRLNDTFFENSDEKKRQSPALLSFCRRQNLLQLSEQCAGQLDSGDPAEIEQGLNDMNDLVVTCVAMLSNSSAPEDAVVVEDIQNKWCSFLGRDVTENVQDKLQDLLTRIIDTSSESAKMRPPPLDLTQKENLPEKFTQAIQLIKQNDPCAPI